MLTVCHYNMFLLSTGPMCSSIIGLWSTKSGTVLLQVLESSTVETPLALLGVAQFLGTFLVVVKTATCSASYLFCFFNSCTSVTAATWVCQLCIQQPRTLNRKISFTSPAALICFLTDAGRPHKKNG